MTGTSLLAPVIFLIVLGTLFFWASVDRDAQISERQRAVNKARARQAAMKRHPSNRTADSMTVEVKTESPNDRCPEHPLYPATSCISCEAETTRSKEWDRVVDDALAVANGTPVTQWPPHLERK